MNAAAPVDTRVTLGDVGVYAVLLGLGALQVALVRRAPDFFTGDVTYYELARSLVEGRPYGFNSGLETTFPPAFPAILALLCVAVGCGHNALIRSMPVFGTLGFVASYELLRREEGRLVAAAICLILMSSSGVFELATSQVLSDLPYFLTSSLSLLLVARLQGAANGRFRTLNWVLLCLLLPLSVLIRSAGLTLVVGLAAWLAISWVAAPGAAAGRIRTLFLPLLLGLLVQGAWMYWGHRHEISEWPIGGYPKSYFSQLFVKSGNDPELGMATLSDVGARVARNAVDRSAYVVELLCRQWVSPEWSSPAVVAATALLVLGLADSVRDGGAFYDWYFMGHETMYLLWPWDFEERFILPVLPLSCLYLWRGGRVLVRSAFRAPRPFARGFLPLAAVLAVGASGWLRRTGSPQATLSLVFWLGSAALAAWLVLADRWPRWILDWAERACRRRFRINRLELSIAHALGLAGVAALVGLGLALQLRIGAEKRDVDLTRFSSYSAVQAATWIRMHSAETAVVMARHYDLVYHYSGRRTVWFPPISDPATLIAGIHRYAVDLIIVTDGRLEYWLPTDRSCFDRLYAAYPDAFRLVHEDPTYRIFSVTEAHHVSPSATRAQPGPSPRAPDVGVSRIGRRQRHAAPAVVGPSSARSALPVGAARGQAPRRPRHSTTSV